VNVRSRPARKPFGASFVIFTLFSRIDIGNIGDGYDVSQSLNFGWMTPSPAAASAAASASRGQERRRRRRGRSRRRRQR
jgi:hypothetical protein